MARPRRQVYTMKQYLDNLNEGYISNDADTQRNPAWKTIVDGLGVTIETDDYIPSIILAETVDGQLIIVDGGSRTAAFNMIRNGNHKIKSSVDNPFIPYRKMVKDDSGKVTWEDAIFDIRNKTFDQFPRELQKKFDEYQVETVIHENCTKDDIAMYMKRYNERKNFSASQKQFLYLPKFAEQIRNITKKQFFIKNCDIEDSKKENGILERIVSECIMITYHFDKWNKNGKRLATYLNENGTEEQFNKLDENISRLENIVMEKTKYLFNGKDTFIWFALFEKFTQFGLDDIEFSRFLEVFIDGLREKEVDGKQFDHVDDKGSTKDKSVIADKLHILETLMKEFLHIEETEMENTTTEEFISEVVNMPVETVREEIDVYEDDLKSYADNVIKCGSKLLDTANHLSLLAVIAYAYQNDIEIDSWLEEYAENNNIYITNQKQNFLHMRDDLNQYHERMVLA